MTHRNATAATLTSTLAATFVYVLGRVGIGHLTAEDGVAIAGAASTVVLFIGQRGIRGTLRAIWRGDAVDTPTPPTPAA